MSRAIAKQIFKSHLIVAAIQVNYHSGLLMKDHDRRSHSPATASRSYCKSSSRKITINLQPGQNRARCNSYNLSAMSDKKMSAFHPANNPAVRRLHVLRDTHSYMKSAYPTPSNIHIILTLNPPSHVPCKDIISM